MRNRLTIDLVYTNRSEYKWILQLMTDYFDIHISFIRIDQHARYDTPIIESFTIGSIGPSDTRV